MSEGKIFAVAGNPILHSRSPEIFQAAFSALSMNDHYYLRFASSRAQEITRAMKDIPVSGFNVTSPFKEKVLSLLDETDDGARKIGAVNLIVNENGRLKGFNTDITGVENAFLENNVMLTGKKAVVLGAGGAAKAAVAALTAAGTDVVVINRTFKKAQSLSETFTCRAVPMEELGKETAEADILVSCLPVGKGVVPLHALRQGLVILDANYGETTTLVSEGARNGCTIIDGREWLLYQGAKAFTCFTGIQKPPIEAMRKTLYEKKDFKKRNIALIGFMGAGKSIIGRHVAEMLKMPLIDIDCEIEKMNNASIEEIFEHNGEEAFRTIEANEIERVAGLPGRVISCGGGAVLNKDSIHYLREYCIVIWLWAGIKTILNRTGENKARPLLNVKDKRSEIETLLTFRKPYYAHASDLFINTDYKKPGEIAERICNESVKFLTN
jgi:shikimate dehydrogenase